MLIFGPDIFSDLQEQKHGLKYASLRACIIHKLCNIGKYSYAKDPRRLYHTSH